MDCCVHLLHRWTVPIDCRGPNTLGTRVESIDCRTGMLPSHSLSSPIASSLQGRCFLAEACSKQSRCVEVYCHLERRRNRSGPRSCRFPMLSTIGNDSQVGSKACQSRGDHLHSWLQVTWRGWDSRANAFWRWHEMGLGECRCLWMQYHSPGGPRND